jgi:hypothetical protein
MAALSTTAGAPILVGLREAHMQAIPGTSVFHIVVQSWSPCTGDRSVLDYLKHSRFPSSYRPLCMHWTGLGRPKMHTATTMTLEEIALREEYVSLVAATGNQPRTLQDFLVFFHKYCSFCVELGTIEAAIQHEAFDANSAYDYNKRMLFAALESDRSACKQHGEHDCLGKRMWGEYLLLSTLLCHC